jgi:hypothetical protein
MIEWPPVQLGERGVRKTMTCRMRNAFILREIAILSATYLYSFL